MSDGFGILISQPGSDITSDIPDSKVLMNTSNPFLKLDTQVKTSFQTITLLITTNPPEPVSGHTYTIVYQFAHGYKYIPAVEFLFFVSSPPPATVFTQLYYLDSIVLKSTTVNDYAALYATVDATNVYFIVDKFNSGSGSANLLSGTNIEITSHVFVDDVGI